MQVDFSAAFLPVPMPDFEFVFPVRVVLERLWDDCYIDFFFGIGMAFGHSLGR
jgi:hypothetical protein